MLIDSFAFTNKASPEQYVGGPGKAGGESVAASEAGANAGSTSGEDDGDDGLCKES